MKTLYPEPLENVREYGGQKFGTQAATRPSHLDRRQGHLLSQKSRTVCGACNSGWMRGLENEVLPYIKQMYHGAPVRLDEKATLALSTWAAMTLAMVETHDPYTASTTAEQRKWMQEQQRPPPVSCVWLGRSEVTEAVGTSHFAARVSVTKSLPSGQTDYQIPFNTKMGAIWIKNILLHVFTSTISTFEDYNPPPALARGLVKLYPTPQAVEWPLALARSAEETRAINRLWGLFITV